LQEPERRTLPCIQVWLERTGLIIRFNVPYGTLNLKDNTLAGTIQLEVNALPHPDPLPNKERENDLQPVMDGTFGAC